MVQGQFAAPPVIRIHGMIFFIRWTVLICRAGWSPGSDAGRQVLGVAWAGAADGVCRDATIASAASEEQVQLDTGWRLFATLFTLAAEF